MMSLVLSCGFRFLSCRTFRTTLETAKGPTPPKYAPICRPDAPVSSARHLFRPVSSPTMVRGRSHDTRPRESRCATALPCRQPIGNQQPTEPKMKNEDLTPSSAVCGVAQVGILASSVGSGATQWSRQHLNLR